MNLNMFDIKEQKDHLLNDLLSTVSMTGRNQGYE